MCELICDVTSSGVWSCDTCTINVYDKIVIYWRPEKERKCGNQRNIHL